MNIEGKPKKRWLDMSNMRAAGVYVKNVEDGDNWRSRSRVADPEMLGRRRRRILNTSKFYLLIKLFTL